MADTKITALAPIGANPVNPATFPIPMVDLLDNSMAASGTTKKVTVNQILGAGGTATLASATITGDLTVDTSTLVVNSSQNRVGIGFSGNASSGRLQISQPLGSTIDGALRITDDATTSFVFNNVSNGVSGIWSSGAIAFGVGSGTFSEAMRLNSTGLGVGTSPTSKLTVRVAPPSGNADGIYVNTGTYEGALQITGSAYNNYGVGANTVWLYSGANNLAIGPYGGTGVVTIVSGGSERFRVDSSGNVGIGVAPSAWASNKALSIGNAGSSLWANSSGIAVGLTQNTYFNGTNFIYQSTAAAAYYNMLSGVHQWFNAPSGTAGQTTTVTSGNSYTITAAGGTNYTTFGAANNNVGTTFTASSSGTGNGGGVTQNITFTQAMTLDASGRLLVNTTSVIGGSGDTLQIAGKTTAGTDYCSMYTGTSTTVYGARYYHTSAVVGSITFTALGTAYNIASDYRLKESVKPLFGGLDRINALKPSTYKWKVNGSDGEGFIAHELAEVIPAAVTGQKDAVNEDGSIQPQQVDLSKVVPVLVAAIQELTARVQTLENR